MRHPEEREQAERETRERASRRLAHFILGETGASGSEDVDGPADGEAAGPAETPPVGSADAGARGL